MIPEEPKNSKIIVIHESLLQSWAKDAVSYGSILVILIINHLFLGGNTILDVLFVVLIVVVFVIRGSSNVHEFNSLEDARDYINSTEVDEL